MGELGVGIIGFGWMGRVHAQAYTRVRHHFPSIDPRPRLVAIADEVPGRAEAAADAVRRGERRPATGAAARPIRRSVRSA